MSTFRIEFISDDEVSQTAVLQADTELEAKCRMMTEFVGTVIKSIYQIGGAIEVPGQRCWHETDERAAREGHCISIARKISIPIQDGPSRKKCRVSGGAKMGAKRMQQTFQKLGLANE